LKESHCGIGGDAVPLRHDRTAKLAFRCGLYFSIAMLKFRVNGQILIFFLSLLALFCSFYVILPPEFYIS